MHINFLNFRNIQTVGSPGFIVKVYVLKNIKKVIKSTRIVKSLWTKFYP